MILSVPLSERIHGDATVSEHDLNKVIHTFEMVTGQYVPDNIEYYFYKNQTFTDPVHLTNTNNPNSLYIGLSYPETLDGVEHHIIKVAMSYDDHTLNTATTCVFATPIWHELTHTTMHDPKFSMNDPNHSNMFWWSKEYGLVAEMVGVGLGMCPRHEKIRLLHLESVYSNLVAKNVRDNRHKCLDRFSHQKAKHKKHNHKKQRCPN